MNLIFSRHRKFDRGVFQRTVTAVTVFAGIILLAVTRFATCSYAQAGGDRASAFKRIAQELSAGRQSGEEGTESRFEEALSYLDSAAISVLNSRGAPDLDAANRDLAGLASHTPPIGENYRLVRLGGASAAYAMVVNFGLGGPAAVRVYTVAAGQFALAAKIDRFVQKDFFDSDIELASVSKTDPVFVTISGRTDDLSTGMFSAWRFDGHGVTALWNSDLLQQSTYDSGDDGFRLAYCSQVDDDHPSNCLKMSRDLYRYLGGQWKRVDTVDLPPAKPAGN